jgi:uncharacterized membrane protein YphA (DoxX/SURF4 family)
MTSKGPTTKETDMVNVAGSTTTSSRARIVAYWASTVLVAGELGLGGVWDILRIPYVRSIIDHLGYPAYFLTILGVWKVLGAGALVAPRLPRLKEWAYAGAVFTYTGAVASHLAVGDGPDAWGFPLLAAGVTGASWALRPPARRDIAAP